MIFTLKAVRSSIVFAALIVALPGHSYADEQPTLNRILPSIVVTTVKMRSLVDRVAATGTIRPVAEVYIQPQVDGLLIGALNFDIGDKVAAGSTLATLNPDALILEKSRKQATSARNEATVAQLRAQLAEARATEEQAQRQQNRSREMGKKGSVPVASVEEADVNATTMEARLSSAEHAVQVALSELKITEIEIADVELKLARTDVTTPVAGTISSKNAKVGGIAFGNNDPLFTIIRDGEIELVAEVGEDEILKIQAGHQASLSLAGGREQVSGLVRLVSPTVDPITRLGFVHIVLTDDTKARPGMYGSAEIIVAKTENVAVPLSAIMTTSEGTSARRVENGVVTIAAIETGIQDGSYVEILRGLKEGDEVVAKAGAYVRDGDRINPVPDPSDASNKEMGR
ncbi:efflux RND transporter periplasmic adaptor subunit [Neorhizobium sp. T6_25]|uniref:efflux RND transporter periplasmic adaptor subunit n=1 Tax=Neorhizobium sp. T6_25 TaxID=2093833 RepID=UPI000CF888C3|nr:efflux RND transporter periplasmic adaptor subunit [Neorhizobium sp. T6_25]